MSETVATAAPASASSLALQVSRAGCLPLGASNVGAGGRCHCCGLQVAHGMDQHRFSARKDAPAQPVCPLCHACLHLDVAGTKAAGIIVWVPELSQVQINLLCALTFTAIVAGLGEHSERMSGLVKKLKTLYRTMESRAAPVEAMLGGKNPLFDPVNPLFFAQLIERARESAPGGAKLSIAEMDRRLDGLRLLPRPKAFTEFIKANAAELLLRYPPEQWDTYVAQDVMERTDV